MGLTIGNISATTNGQTSSLRSTKSTYRRQVHSDLATDYYTTSKITALLSRRSVSLSSIVVTKFVIITMILFLHNNVPRATCFAFRPSYPSFTKRRPHLTSATASLLWNYVPTSILSRHLHANLPISSRMKKHNRVRNNNNNNNMRTIHHLFSSSDELIDKKQKQQQQQEQFKSRIENWPCLYESSNNSEFVTHFVAVAADSNWITINGKHSDEAYDIEYDAPVINNINITVEEAILSVLPKEVLPTRHQTPPLTLSSAISVIELRNSLIEREKESVVSSVEAQMRHDPKQFPLDTQLCPAELIALGSIWFLSGSAPRGDPAFGGKKPVRLELKDLTRRLEVNDYLRIHHSPRRFPVINAYDWGKNCATTTSTTMEDELKGNRTSGDEDDSVFKRQQQGYEDLPGILIAEDREKGYLIVNKPPGVPVHATVDNVLENVSAAVGRSLLRRNLTLLKETIHNKTESSKNDVLLLPIHMQCYFPLKS